MPTELFVLNLPDGFTVQRILDLLDGCHVTSVVFARTGYGLLASIVTASEEDASQAETILDALGLPAPLGIVRGDSLIGQKLGEMVVHIIGAGSETYMGAA